MPHLSRIPINYTGYKFLPKHKHTTPKRKSAIFISLKKKVVDLKNTPPILNQIILQNNLRSHFNRHFKSNKNPKHYSGLLHNDIFFQTKKPNKAVKGYKFKKLFKNNNTYAQNTKKNKYKIPNVIIKKLIKKNASKKSPSKVRFNVSKLSRTKRSVKKFLKFPWNLFEKSLPRKFQESNDTLITTEYYYIYRTTEQPQILDLKFFQVK